MSIQTQEGDTSTYLFLMGINPERPIQLAENLTIEPVTCYPNPDDMIGVIMNQEIGSCRETDLGILISTMRQTTAQLLIKGVNANQLAVHAWNAQSDVTLLSALTGKEIYWHIQSNKGADEFSKDSYINIVVNTRMYIPQSTSLIKEAECTWLENNFSIAARLMDEKRFYTAVNSLWAYRMNPNPFVQMAVLWAGIESLVGAGSYELSYRISTITALFLDTGAEGRNSIKKLYNARSKAVHEGHIKDIRDVNKSAALLRDLLLKCIEVVDLPNEEKLMFGYAAK